MIDPDLIGNDDDDCDGIFFGMMILAWTLLAVGVFVGWLIWG